MPRSTTPRRRLPRLPFQEPRRSPQRPPRAADRPFWPGPDSGECRNEELLLFYYRTIAACDRLRIEGGLSRALTSADGLLLVIWSRVLESDTSNTITIPKNATPMPSLGYRHSLASKETSWHPLSSQLCLALRLCRIQLPQAGSIDARGRKSTAWNLGHLPKHAEPTPTSTGLSTSSTALDWLI